MPPRLGWERLGLIAPLRLRSRGRRRLLSREVARRPDRSAERRGVFAGGGTVCRRPGRPDRCRPIGRAPSVLCRLTWEDGSLSLRRENRPIPDRSPRCPTDRPRPDRSGFVTTAGPARRWWPARPGWRATYSRSTRRARWTFNWVSPNPVASRSCPPGETASPSAGGEGSRWPSRSRRVAGDSSSVVVAEHPAPEPLGDRHVGRRGLDVGDGLPADLHLAARRAGAGGPGRRPG